MSLLIRRGDLSEYGVVSSIKRHRDSLPGLESACDMNDRRPRQDPKRHSSDPKGAIINSRLGLISFAVLTMLTVDGTQPIRGPRTDGLSSASGEPTADTPCTLGDEW